MKKKKQQKIKENAEQKAQSAKEKRDPFAVLEKFATPLPEMEESEKNASTDINGEELFDESIIQEEYAKAAEREKPKSKKKSIIFSLVFLAINIAFVAFLSRALLKSADSSFIDLFRVQGKRMWWLVLSVGLMIITLLGDAAAFLILIKKTTGKWRPWLAYKTTCTGKYYDAITPFALGTQPGQIVQLTKGGVSPGIATSIPIMKLILYNIVNVVLGVAFLVGVGTQITSVVVLKEGAKILLIVFKVFAYIGIVISVTILTVIILIANSKMAGRSLARFVVRVGYKLRFVKDYRKSYNKLMHSVTEFQGSMKYFKKHKGVLFSCVGCILVSLFALASIPFTITLALTDVKFATAGDGFWLWLESIARYYICFNAANYIPLPGGTGMIEIAFIAMFGNSRVFPTQSQYVYGFLIWRIICYYLIILQGMILIIIDTARSIASTRKTKIKINQQKQSQKQV